MALALEPVPLFLVGKVADNPAEAVHGPKASLSLLPGDAIERAYEFGAGEAEVINERVGHERAS